VTERGFRAWGSELSNWGRWGDEDQRGTLNWTTPEHIAAAAGLVRDGEVISLGLPLDANGPQASGGPRMNPVHIMTRTAETPPEPGGYQWMDDYLVMYPQGATQLDALSHVAYDGFLYNGVPAGTVGPAGAARLGVQGLRDGITGRGVLLDLPRHLRLDRLAADRVIEPADLDACLAAQGTDVGEGDILLLRTGWLGELRQGGPRSYLAREPGIALPATRWLAERHVAFVASDNWGVEVAPPTGQESMPVHCVLVRDMGMPLGEMFDLDALAVSCAQRQRWEFFFTAHPLQITGGTGSPLDPKAIL
jgi:kynurenine formamidase